MTELAPKNSRRNFLRAACGLGALALGAEAALGMGLRPEGTLALTQETRCRSITRTATQAAVSTMIEAGTKTITKTSTHTRSGGTASRTKAIGETVTEVVPQDGPPPNTITALRSIVATPPVTYVYTLSYAPGGVTYTESVPYPYTMEVSLTLTQLWWQHSPDCNGRHGDGDATGGGDDGTAAHPGRSSSTGAPVDVLDAQSRWTRLTLPDLD